jgi:hypothetical protein
MQGTREVLAAAVEHKVIVGRHQAVSPTVNAEPPQRFLGAREELEGVTSSVEDPLVSVAAREDVRHTVGENNTGKTSHAGERTEG